MSSDESRLTTLGDFGAGGDPSPAGDAFIDREAAAKEAATAQWEFLIHTDERVAWHVDGTTAMLLLKATDHGWQMERAGKRVGPRLDTLHGGLELAADYMRDHPNGEKPWHLGGGGRVE